MTCLKINHFPGVEWYDIDSSLDYSCRAVSPLGVDRLATGTLFGRKQKVFRPKFSVNRQKDHLSDVSHHIGGR